MAELNGGGKGFPANVDDDFQLEAKTNNVSRGAFVNLNDKQAYSQYATYTTADVTDYFYFLKNNSSTKNCHVVGVRLQATAADSVSVWRGTSGTPAGGAAITPVNMGTSENTADVTSYGDANITGLTDGSQVDMIFATAAAESKYHEFPTEIILGQNDTFSLKGTAAETWFFTVYFYMK